ncbi:hypothetical protein TNCV_787521 [Trichonephila clavipes]|nr:hypothetical protein TNCV_787521 [Trichonephila clavipes]
MKQNKVSRVDEHKHRVVASKTIQPSKLCGLEHCHERTLWHDRLFRKLVNGLSTIFINITFDLGNVCVIFSCRKTPRAWNVFRLTKFLNLNMKTIHRL